jgi:hypothetical protein
MARSAPPPSTVRGALHAKGGYQVLCISSDLAFSSTIARLAKTSDTHTSTVWSLEDVERLPFWEFHGIVADDEAWHDLMTRASARGRTLLGSRAVAVGSRSEPTDAFRALLADMTAAHAGHL